MRVLFVLMLLAWSSLSHADIYLESQVFVQQQFSGHPPQPQVIWLNGELKAKLAGVLQHKYTGLRIRYWQGEENGLQTVWVLNEIGKEKNITVGITVAQDSIKTLQVLAFRESRGWEVKHGFFTRQFVSMFLKKDMQLSGHIDGITGATMSVRAVKKLAKVALLLHSEVQQ
ncbi:MAG: FMN-binding protein [Ghiorsea sp.]|nr:FMN-binding protein [Ghiorsea sp.]